jgi:hypothetical protein
MAMQSGIANAATSITSASATFSDQAATATPVTVDFSFTLPNLVPVGGIITMTFPAGFTMLSAPTGGSNLGTSPTLAFSNAGPKTFSVTCGTGGCAAGATTITGGTVTNPATGSYMITIDTNNATPDNGVVATSIVDSDTTDVTASVDPSLTFNVGTQLATVACATDFSGNGGSIAGPIKLNSLPIGGTIASSDIASIVHICTRVTTNANGGYVVTVKSRYGQLRSISNVAHAFPVAQTGLSTGVTISAGTEGYGLCVKSDGGSGNSFGAAVTATSPFDGGGTCVASSTSGQLAGKLTTTASPVLSASGGPSSASFATLYLKAAATAMTPAHNDYFDSLTFIATGTF